MHKHRKNTSSSVIIWQKLLTIPTYQVGEAENNPLFYNGRQTQHAQAHFYPYPAIDKLSKDKKDRIYKAIYLENEYIKVIILPELGGRIYDAVDKTNGYHFIYRNNVIKPSLIGMTGAWISGGIEWCFPHHHRASTFMTVDHKIDEHEDGSKTVWVGELEWRHRMKWVVGVRLHPGRSYIEAEVKLFNQTPYTNSVLYWANAAMHSNKDYQTIFPPSAEIACFHTKNYFTQWPVSQQTCYEGINYKDVDLPWWKNHPKPISFFVHKQKEDFHGGYDHGRKAGIMHVADVNKVNCAKLWQWGPSTEGTFENSKLTDADGDYVELMVGAYSDNQPDYSWMEPHQYRTFRHFWYPIRDIRGAHNANIDAVVFLDSCEDNNINIRFNTTSKFKNATVLLTNELTGELLLKDIANIAPDKPYSNIVKLTRSVEIGLVLSLISEAGETIISYSPKNRANPGLPDPVLPPEKPAKIDTIEELYQIAVRLFQFYNPVLSAYPYLEEALRRDPTDTRVNAFLGILYCKRAMFKEAEQVLRVAVKKLETRYTQPQKGEVYYYLANALMEQDKVDEAREHLFHSAWFHEWYSSSYFILAQIESRKGNYYKALEYINETLATNAYDNKALALKLVLLRKLDLHDDFEHVLKKAIELDPFNMQAFNENYLKSRQESKLFTFIHLMRNDKENYLELGSDYASAGFYEEAATLLEILISENIKNASKYPMLYYHSGYYYYMSGHTDKARVMYHKAAEMPIDYCFPFRFESIRILNHANQTNITDANALLYLGNLLYNHQHDSAIAAWEKAIAINKNLALAYRNLGFALTYGCVDLPRARKMMEQAVLLNSDDPLWLEELDKLYELMGADPQTRLQPLMSNITVVMKRPEAVFRLAKAYVHGQDYDKALKLLKENYFFNYEARRDKHELYAQSLLLRGERYVINKDYAKALEDYLAALEYPENLETGKPHHDDKGAHIFYKIANVYKALGDKGRANIYYKRSTDCKNFLEWSDLNYYQGLSYRELGDEEKAKSQFAGLVKNGKLKIQDDRWYDFYAGYNDLQPEVFQKADNQFQMALGYLGLNDRKAAKKAINACLRLHPAHVWAFFINNELKT